MPDQTPITGMDLLSRLEARVIHMEERVEELLEKRVTREELTLVEDRLTRQIEQQVGNICSTMEQSVGKPLAHMIRVNGERISKNEKRLDEAEDSTVLFRTAVAQLTRMVERHQKLLMGNGTPSLAELARTSMATSQQALDAASKTSDMLVSLREAISSLTTKMELLFSEQQDKNKRGKAAAKIAGTLLEKSPLLVGALGGIVATFSSLWLWFISQVPITQVALFGGFVLAVTIIFVVGLISLRGLDLEN